MVFSSVIFLSVFLPLFLLSYYLSGKSNAVILLFSLIFYAWGGPAYIPLLLFYAFWNYAFGIIVGKASKRRRITLGVGLAGNLVGLLYFKYLGFVAAQLNVVFSSLDLGSIPDLGVLLPLGISFFSFQGMSYLIDVYRGDVEAQRSWLTFATYKAMFPQLVAGPIVRYSQLAEELKERSVDGERFSYGILTFAVGLAQKVLIANPLAVPADQIFALPPERLTAAAAWLGVLCYTAQIYFDFCGYSNMAIGLGHMMGFTLPPNFNRPYVAQSATEFWRRWHISLSTWFRDYLYIPLGGSRKGKRRTYLNLTAVFVLCGMWHGASWTFLIWGGYWGVLLAIERAGLGAALERRWRPFRHAYLILAVIIGWAIFRADTLRHAASMLEAMAGFGVGEPSLTPIEQYLRPSVATTLVFAALLSIIPSSPKKLPRLELRQISSKQLANSCRQPRRNNRTRLSLPVKRRGRQLQSFYLFQVLSMLYPTPLASVISERLGPRLAHTAFAVVFFGILILPLCPQEFMAPVLRILRLEDAKTAEKRNLASLPTMPRSLAELDQYPQKVNAYFSDRFGMRPAMISLNNRIRLALFKETPTEQTVFGPTGRLFFTSHGADSPYSHIYGVCGIGITETAVDAVAGSIARLIHAIEERHLNGLVTLIPTAPIVYRSELPDWLRSRCRGPSSADRIVSRLAKSLQEGRFAYPLEPMLSAAKSDFGAFPKFNFHWGGDGPRFTAEYLANQILGRAKILTLVPKVIAAPSDLSGSMEGISLISTTVVPDFDTAGVDFCFGATCFPELGTIAPVIADMTRISSPASGRRLLLVSDSFGAMIAPWFAEYYGSVRHFATNGWTRLSDEDRLRFVDLFLRQYEPDDVIFLFHDGAGAHDFDETQRFLFGPPPGATAQ